MARITRYTPTPIMPSDTRYEPGFLWPVTRLQQQMNRLFSDVFRGLEEGGDRGDWTFNPVVDIEQQDDQYEISVELAGVRSEDVNVEVTEDMLTISGSKERKETRGEGENRRSERMYGSFQRAFQLPEDAVPDQIRAEFREGVLTVTVPRDESRRQSQVRRIEVQTGAEGGESRQQQQQQVGTGKEGERPSPTH